MKRPLSLSIGAIASGTALLAVSVILLQNHFQALKDVREYALPLAAEVPPLERREALLSQQMELSTLESSLRNDSADEKLRTYVLPQGNDLTRLLAFLESAQTFLQRRGMLKSMSAITVDDAVDEHVANATGETEPAEPLQSRTLHFTAVMKSDGRAQLFSILDLSGMLTVGDALSPENIKTLFSLTESQNYAGIVPVEQFLSADLLDYVQDPRIVDARLSQALSSEEFLNSFKNLLQSSQLPAVKELLTGDLGRTMVAQKLWPVQFMTIEKESVTELPDDWENVDLTVKAYARK